MTDLASVRTDLHRIAAHVLARRRKDVSGRIGLRATVGGIGTPAFGEGPEVVRIAGAVLVRETKEGSATMPIAGASLRDLAGFVDADVDAPLDLGADTPAVGDPDAPIVVADEAFVPFADWYDLGWRALDAVVAHLGAEGQPSVIQIWPEHFDAAVDVAVGGGARVNLGASPGDGFHAEPYLYVGPWGPERPGDSGYWNAGFGAFLGRADIDGPAGAVDFLLEGISRLRT
ncbi:MAG: hypothetical protein ACYDH6_16140 [Acidimicrobiales bacterium]